MNYHLSTAQPLQSRSLSVLSCGCCSAIKDSEVELILLEDSMSLRQVYGRLAAAKKSKFSNACHVQNHTFFLWTDATGVTVCERITERIIHLLDASFRQSQPKTTITDALPVTHNKNRLILPISDVFWRLLYLPVTAFLGFRNRCIGALEPQFLSQRSSFGTRFRR